LEGVREQREEANLSISPPAAFAEVAFREKDWEENNFSCEGERKNAKGRERQRER
jgi:hypothetical protein